jgi:starch phosphorylase
MKPVSTFVVSPTMPAALAPLKELAYNFWWCWHEDAIDLFRRIDPVIWEAVHHNPVALISSIPNDRLLQLADRVEYINQLTDVYARFRQYMEERGWYASVEPKPSSYIAYFCAEFGIHESFSCYSGGLGVLAGDHLKSASDLGIPLVAVGLLYQEGYFRQYLTQNGWQNEQYLEVDFHMQAITKVTKADGTPLMVSVDLPLGTCHAQIWRLNVGRVPLYLLDTNVPENTFETLRDVTDRLYGGGTDTRIMQEMMLGIGGVRALAALGIEPAAIHINEGHAAFSMLERSRQFMNRFHMSFEEAWQVTKGTSVFTTHTPVPAGNEVFTHDILEPFFAPYLPTLGLTWDQFKKLGAQLDPETEEGFSMTVLGLRGSTWRNGVSELHGHVSREMWTDVWKDFSLEETPIIGLTNGVHTKTWVAPEIADLYDRYIGPRWRTEPHVEETWANVDAIPNIELWRAHQRRRERLVIGAREHILSKHSASLTADQASRIHECLDPDIMTIGFARRFASYKRADLIMTDMDRLARIINNAERPVQLILAGKAHPRDGAGKDLIQSVHQKIKENGLDTRIVFLEDYDMDVARLMVRGCDVWLNTPRRPYEASGTSGMKAAANGVVNCSILDGWWAEAFDGENGFAIGRGEEFEPDDQDAADSATLYDILEHAVVPMFYEVGKSRLPEQWLSLMKRNIRTNIWRFSALRMVQDYSTKTYRPAMANYRTLTENSAQAARDAVQFFHRVDATWSKVAVGNVVVHGGSDAHVGKEIHVTAEVHLGDLAPENVVVQAVHGRVDAKGHIADSKTSVMRLKGISHGLAQYEGEYLCQQSGKQGCTVRVLPTHPTLINPVDAMHASYAQGNA